MTSPGEASQPEDTQGDGPVSIGDRTEPGGQGSPDTNQAKTEPKAEAREAPDLESMNVGAGDPQSASHAALTPPSSPAGGSVGDAAGVPVPAHDGTGGSSETMAPGVDAPDRE